MTPWTSMGCDSVGGVPEGYLKGNREKFKIHLLFFAVITMLALDTI
jgi:hypothetical protein